MIERFQHRGLASWGRIALAGVAAAVLMTGCGGGGGGGGSTPPSTVTLIGQLKDTATSNVLPNRTVTVQSTSLSGVSDSSGNFTINSVPVTTITLSVVDSNGASNGTATFNLSKYSGNPRSVGVVSLSVSGGTNGGPPPPPT